MPAKGQEDNQQKKQVQNDNDQQSVSQGKQSAGQEQANGSRGVPLTAEQQQTDQGIQQQIESFESQLEQKSNTQLKDIATKLESVEREALLEKIDQELQTVKEAIVKPGDSSASVSAATAGAAAVVLNEKGASTGPS